MLRNKTEQLISCAQCAKIVSKFVQGSHNLWVGNNFGYNAHHKQIDAIKGPLNRRLSSQMPTDSFVQNFGWLRGPPF